MTIPKKLTVSVIIPVHNGGASFRQCLSNLIEAVSNETEVIVVADGDTDGSWRVAEEFGAKVLRIPVCGGPAQARNLGARAASGDILFFVDADVTVYSDTITQVANIFACQPDLAALIGSYDDAPGANNFLSQYKNLFHHYTHQTASEQAFTFWGACGAIRREIFLQLGGFDESYRRPSIEDIELGYRISKAGHTIQLCKDLQVKHLKRWGVISLLRAELFYRAIPWTELIWCDRQLKNDLNLGVKSRLSIVLAYLLLGVLVLGALVGAFWWAVVFAVGFFLSFLLLIINFPVYRFFFDKRGLWFALQVIPWHWFYYLYGGLGFAIGTVKYFWSQKYSAKSDISTVSLSASNK
jgi:glycosyltransferase involved in cell wall biosynthesis